MLQHLSLDVLRIIKNIETEIIFSVTDNFSSLVSRTNVGRKLLLKKIF